LTAKPLVVIVSGPPCTGKTTLGKYVAAELGLPFINKDGIKERLFDTLGWSDRQWSRKLGVASYALLYYFIEAQVAVGRSFVVESNFDPVSATAQFLELKSRHDFEPVQVMCRTQGEELFARFRERAESGQRHPGHVDRQSYEEIRPVLLEGRLEPLGIGGTVIEVDTTDFGAVDCDKVVSTIREADIVDRKRSD
jgi:predicted kinase